MHLPFLGKRGVSLLIQFALSKSRNPKFKSRAQSTFLETPPPPDSPFIPEVLSIPDQRNRSDLAQMAEIACSDTELDYQRVFLRALWF